MQALAFSPVSIQTQRTQRKRLRLDGNRALFAVSLFLFWFYLEVNKDDYNVFVQRSTTVLVTNVSMKDSVST